MDPMEWWTFRGTTSLGWTVWYVESYYPPARYTVVKKDGADKVYKCRDVDEEEMFQGLAMKVGSLSNRGRIVPQVAEKWVEE